MTFFELDSVPVRELALAAGLASDAAAIREWLAALPQHAYGQVLIESDEPIGSFPAPAGVAINRVPLGLEPGEGLARAVCAWFDEWLWVDSDVDRTLTLWVGEDHVPAMGECWERLDRRIARKHFAPGAEFVHERV